MIPIKFHISLLIVPVAAIAAFTGCVPQFVCAYAVMVLHECAHLIAAMCIGLKPDTFCLSPFGAHLTLKNKIVRSLSDEIILYASGPLLNGVLAVVCLYLGFHALYRMNTALMLMNLLPVMPLDGGVILKRILSRSIGKSAAEKILTSISVICSLLFLAAAIYGWYIKRLNISMFIMTVFFMGNAVTGKELYDVDFISGLSGNKKTNRVRVVMVDDKHSMLDAARMVSAAYNTVALVKEAGQYKLISEEDILNNTLKKTL